MIKVFIDNKMYIVESEKQAMKLIEADTKEKQKGIRRSVVLWN